MPPASQTEHKVIANTALPYISNSSIVSTDPQYIQGSRNIMTSLRQWSERFPGFSTTIVPGTWQSLKRQFVWHRWSGVSPNAGAFIWIGCDIQGGVATVWKYQFGTDVVPVLIWTSASAEPFDFVVSNNTLCFGNGTDMKKYDSVTVWKWGIATPLAGPTLALVAGTANVFTSWCYCYTYYNSNTGHESSPSAISACSGVFSAKNVNVSVVASTDPQVTNIRIYRTPDGGAQDPTEMQEISGSPFPNTTATITDNTPDVNLSIRVAPAFLRNDPPTPSKGFVTYSGRIWGFVNNIVYYSGFEEIANGVPEESWPSGLNGNFYPYANEVFGLAPLIDGVAVYQSHRVGKIEGDSLDTFRRYTLLERRGALSRTAIVSLGGSVAWLDTSNTIWVSDLGEVGKDIRPDLVNLNAQNCWLAIHISGIYHWLMLLDGDTGNLWTYDLDTSQWMPPRTVGAHSTALYSFETSTGTIDLLLGRNATKALKLVSGTYNDDGTNYDAEGRTTLNRMTPGDNPSWQGNHDWTELKTDGNPPAGSSILTDEDPTTGTYTALPTVEPSPLLVQGTALQSWRYVSFPQSAAYASLKFTWNADGQNFHLYQIDHAYSPAGG